MKFLVDECTGTSVVACLRDEGHDAMAVVEVMPEADDEVLDFGFRMLRQAQHKFRISNLNWDCEFERGQG